MTKLLNCIVLGLGLILSSGAFAAERTVTLAVQNMYCVACPSIVKKSIEAVPGVAKAAVSYKEKTAIVIFDDTKASVAAIVKATTEAGYPSAPKR